MYMTGFADEAADSIDMQIQATKELGWKNIEARGLYGKNLASISENEFCELCGKLDESGVKINCYGSGIANWASPINESPEASYEEMKNAIPRMKKLGIKLIRIMSFEIPKELRENDYHDEVVKRLKLIMKMAEDNDIICVHENCMDWGGLSYEHTLRMLEDVDSPNLKLVFDTGNPVFLDDVRGKPPYSKQNSYEFYQAVKEHIEYVHIKDLYLKDGKEVYTFPGEGDGCVVEILTDLIKSGYDGGFSIEPHMETVFHDENNDPAGKEKARYSNYIEYGKRAMKIIEDIKH